MITHCKFCKTELAGILCFNANCKFGYMALNNGTVDVWDFTVGKYFIDVFPSYTRIYLNNGKTFDHTLIGSVDFQILPDATEEDINVYITFI